MFLRMNAWREFWGHLPVGHLPVAAMTVSDAASAMSAVTWSEEKPGKLEKLYLQVNWDGPIHRFTKWKLQFHFYMFSRSIWNHGLSIIDVTFWEMGEVDKVTMSNFFWGAGSGSAKDLPEVFRGGHSTWFLMEDPPLTPDVKMNFFLPVQFSRAHCSFDNRNWYKEVTPMDLSWKIFSPSKTSGILTFC